MNTKRRACHGEGVSELGDYAGCDECGTCVRWDLRDDAFWGFQHCRNAPRPNTADTEQVVGDAVSEARCSEKEP